MSEGKIALSPFDVEDWQGLALLLAWRQNREVMKYLPSAPVLPTWAEHYNHLLEEDTTYYWVMVDERVKRNSRYDNGNGGLFVRLLGEVLTRRPVGVVHFKRDGEVGIIIGEKAIWGQGVGKKALARLRETLPASTPLWAVIHPDNIASQKVFEANGFLRTSEPGRNGQLVYRGFS